MCSEGTTIVKIAIGYTGHNLAQFFNTKLALIALAAGCPWNVIAAKRHLQHNHAAISLKAISNQDADSISRDQGHLHIAK